MVIRFNIKYAPGTCIYKLLGKNRRKYQKKADKVFCNVRGYVHDVLTYQNGDMLVVDIPLLIKEI